MRNNTENISFYVAELRFKTRISDSKFTPFFLLISIHTFKDLKGCTQNLERSI